MPTKPGHVPAPAGDAHDDTLQAEPSLEPSDSAAAVTSIPPAERYRLGAELGRGGMGRVVEAFDLQLGRTVALKEVLPRGGAAVARRFAREVQLTARLEHPSIIPLYDAGVTVDGRPFYVMRRVSGRPLDQLMAGAVGLGERLTLLPAVLSAIDAIAHAHRRGVIHRDLKPANILVGELGDTVVIDWGLAKVIGEDDDKPGTVIATAGDSLRTQIGSVFGTPGFMAPEQARGEELDPRGDVYALGATLYQLLAGAPPHSGTSATEVIENTGSKQVVPVDVVAPGAPPELVAIVGKALAFDPTGRYPDAGALGEDVRRFLAGQLVAAHRYTPRQRFTRFARRHRAPLAVAALAMLAVAVLSWVAVHRIVTERDAATAARAEADAQRAEAVVAGAQAVRRSDQLLVASARSLVDRNPTHALAILKHLRDGSDRLGDARAVAQAAAVRGAAWSIPSSELPTTIAELSGDARFLLQVMFDGLIQIWDLDRRRLVVSRGYSTGVRAVWVGRAVLITPPQAAPELFDPFTGAIRPIPVEPIGYATATTAGDRVAYLDRRGGVNLLDVAAGTARPLWPGHTAEHVAIAPDGSWIEAADKTTIAVLDPTGRELATHPGPVVTLLASQFGDAGFASADKVALVALTPRPVWRELALPPYPIDFAFRGHRLHIYLASGKVIAWDGTRQWDRLALHGFTGHMLEVGRDLLVVPGIDGVLHIVDDLVTGELHLPTPLRNLRIAGRPGVSRIVAVGAGLILGFDLDSLPVQLATPPSLTAAFVDDDTLLLWGPQGGPWQWYDVRTAAATAFPYAPRGIPQVAGVDSDGGRVLIREYAGDSDSYLVVLHKNAQDSQRLVRGRAVWGVLLPRGGLVFGVGDGRVFGIVAGGAPREIAKLDGAVDAVTGFGDAGFAAVSRNGELVRGSLATGALTRAQLAPGTTSAIAADAAGRVVIAQDNRLVVWDRDVVELARLDKRVVRIAPCDGGALIELADHAVVRSSLVPGAPV
ncbi:MAG TPA: serine/threonine-protein kinase, partial [Kofleriaceae bacterium]|nr:serine/threonine-protein kinase [Kofleriaceae bacterium]